MKIKSFTITLAASLVLTAVSCGKTTKGKLDGEWKVTEYSDLYNYTNTSNNSSSVSTEKHDGSTLNYTSTSTNGGGSNTTTSTKKILEHTYVFKKDGTYSELYSTEATSTTGGTTQIVNYVRKIEGHWNFVSPNTTEDFKKNERIALTISNYNSTTTTTTKVGTTSNTITSTNNSEIEHTSEISYFTVVESSNKELKLQSFSSSSNSQNGTTSSEDTNLTLTAK